MHFTGSLYLFLLASQSVYAQSTVLEGSRSIALPSGTIGDDGIPTGRSISYLSLTTTRSLTPTTSTISIDNSTISFTATDSSAASADLTRLVGTNLRSSQTSSSTSPEPTNTQPCNAHVEFCDRSYGNLTFVGAHNSPFALQNNVASNQDNGVLKQLDDGIRMLQGQTHFLNGVLHFCHTSCDLLNAGTVEDYFRDVSSWLDSHPYEVITILIGNSDLRPPSDFVDPIQKSGLGRYVYTPPKLPMGLSDWPTLVEMIFKRTRAVVFMDYGADEDAVPYILDEFSQLWETPFSPTDRNFPCTVQRPPELSDEKARDRLYMANHNLNTQVKVAGLDILLPNTVQLNETNAKSGFGSLGLAAENCESEI